MKSGQRKTRALTDEEVNMISNTFSGNYENRDRALFILGVRTGFRISELLSLTIGDVVQNGKIVDRIVVSKSKMKEDRTRSVPLHPEAKEALSKWLDEFNKLGYTDPDDYIFHSQRGENKPISRVQAYRIIKEASNANQLIGSIGTHSMRKTLGTKAYKQTKDIYKVAKVLGHSNVKTTEHYLDITQDDIDDIILSC